jgi:hypothetical protein
MDIETAKRAGELARGIELRIQKRAAVELGIAEHWPVIEVLARNTVTNETKSLVIGELNDATSQQGLAFIKAIYDSEIAAMQAEIDAIGVV